MLPTEISKKSATTEQLQQNQRLLETCRVQKTALAWFPVALGLLVLVVAALAGGEALACPTCKQGLAESDPAGQAMVAGYFYSILFMMSMPFLILGTFGSCAYWSICRARNQQTEDEQTS